MRSSIVVVLAAVVLALTGCGDEGAGEDRNDSDQADSTSESACGEVWVEGEVLPEGYDGCIQDGGRVLSPRHYPCDDGRKLHRYREEFYAFEGETIVAESDEYFTVLENCLNP